MADPIFPPGVSARQFDLATADFVRAIGQEWVLTSDTDRDSYADFFSFDGRKHLAAGALAPATTE